MTATLQIKSGRPNYFVLIRYRDENTGKERQKWVCTDIPVKGNNKRKADEKLKQVIAEYEQQKVDLGKDVLFTEFMQNWLEGLKHSLAPTTFDGYSYVLNSHIIPFFKPKSLKVKDLTPAHIQQYVNYKMKTVSSNTVIKHLRNISKCLDSAVRQNMIAFNPVKRIEMPKKKKYTGAKFYNEKQIEQFLEASKSGPLEIVILLTVFYGLRRSEVLGLRWNIVDFDNNTITINHTVTQFIGTLHKLDATKNDSSCTVIPLPDFIKSKLKRWKAQQAQYKWLQPNDYIDEGYVCTQPDGSLILPNYVSAHFARLLKHNNLPHIRFHDLRHSSASYLFYLGFNLKEIQTWQRHGDIQTTMNLYTHLDMSAKRNIADNLNERFANFEL